MKKCPFYKKDCIKDSCMFWTHLIGKNPQTGAEIDEFNCAISFLPMLLIENAKNVSQTQAAVESFRNKAVKFQDMLVGAINTSRKLSQVKEPKELDSSENLIIDVKEE